MQDNPVGDDDIRSGRSGRTNIWIGGFKYTASNTKRLKIYYRCSHYRGRECKGACHFVRSTQSFENFVPHTGGRSAVPLESNGGQPTRRLDVADQMKREVDHLAVTTTASRSVIWDIVRGRFYGNPDTNTAFSGLRREDVFRRVNRARHEEYGGSLYGQIESPPWSQVLNDDGSASETNFHLFHYSYYDKSKKKRERLLGWGHPVLLNMLKQKRTDVFVDGTFKTVPPKFKQCLIFSTYDRPTRAYYPAAFILCTSKKYAVYFHAMRLLLDKTDYTMDPEFVCCDFEAGLIRAIRDHFPQGLPVGCLCHFKQACRRKMKAYGIPDDQCRVAMRSGVLDMLTVIKQDKVKGPGLLWVQEKITTECLAQGIVVSTEKWTKFWKYFKRTWITTFPPSLWNIEPYTKALVSRTNNPSERFNREMNAAFPAPHPNLADFVVGIEVLARRYANLKYDIDIGRARAPARLPIPLPKAVVLPDAVSGSSSESSEGSADSSDEETDNFLRPDLRSRYARRHNEPMQDITAELGQVREVSEYYENTVSLVQQRQQIVFKQNS